VLNRQSRLEAECAFSCHWLDIVVVQLEISEHWSHERNNQKYTPHYALIGYPTLGMPNFVEGIGYQFGVAPS